MNLGPSMNIEQFYRRINERARRDFQLGALHEVIESTCIQHADSIAVVCANQQQTFDELRIRSNRIANYLQSHGIGRGDLVGVCCNRDIDLPAILTGILKSGAGYVPLDPDYPLERLTYMVNDSQLIHVLAHEAQDELTSNFGKPTTLLDRDWHMIQAASDSLPENHTQADSDVAYVIYTSGSTGKPKGVIVPHAPVVNMLFGMIEWPGFTETDRVMATTTLSFDISVVEIFLPLVTGGSVAVVDRQTAKDTGALVAAMKQHQVNFMQATPAMWRMIVEADFPGRAAMKFITAGEPLPRDLIRPMLDRCGEVWNLYGPTEATVYASGIKIDSDQGRILIGDPVANTEIFVVDENNELCPPDSPGELLIGGAGLTLGYLNRPELNSEKFCKWNGVDVYRTGDLAQVTPDGQIDHLGRIDDQIKFHGHRIELGEIDACLAMQPGVRQAATVLREDQPGDQRLVGYLLPTNDRALDIGAIRQAIGETLPDYMVPSVLVSIDEFRYTPSGKLDRKAFPAPSTARPEVGTEYVLPKLENEQQLAQIWAEVLQLDRVGTRDNFFELGGNSIRAAKVVARTHSETDLRISTAELFDNPTIQAVIALADQKQKIRQELSSQQTVARPDSCPAGFAIVGMSAKMPGAADLNEFWDNLVQGRESIRFFEPQELDKTLDPRDTQAPNYVAARGMIDQADHFDARFFKMPPRNAELMDPQQRIMLELAWSALEDAGIVPDRTNETIGIWAGTYSTSYFIKNVLTHPELVRETGEFNVGVFNEKDYIATRVAHALNLTGPAINVNTACSTSLVALIEACKSLESGHCDVAIAGGASVTFPQHSGHLHQTGSIFSPDGHCRPFDAKAGGTLFSDGAGLVVVKRLADAIANQDRIYAVVRGYGINNDGGNKASFSAPSIKGQTNAIAMAQSMANFEPDSISYIEAHGTATPVGDPIEVSALQNVFESSSDQKQFCGLGSVKSNIGHTVAAAGVAGLIKVAKSLHHGQIPATLHYQQPNPQIDFANSPFFVCDSLQDWKRNETPRRAGVSSFGVGGTNAHIVLEEAPLVEQASDLEPGNELPIAVVPLSGKSEDALLANADNLANFLASTTGPALETQSVAKTLQTGRDAFAHRAAIVVDSLNAATEILSARKAPQFMKGKASASSREIVFMFPGQGAQYVRMGQDLYEHSSVFRKHLDECAELLEPLLGRDLREVLFPPAGDEEAAQEILKNTQFTQPALFSLGYSLAKTWLAWGLQPDALMGHSIGEFAAACVAGVFKLADGLKIIAERGRAMQALPGGSMMSVRLPGIEVEPLLFDDLAIGSYNGPSLCVVSGPDDQVARLQQQLESQDVACRHLHTSHAFHSPMMDEIVEPFTEFVRQFELLPPQIPILSTVTGEWMNHQQATDPKYWADHLRAPVRFSNAVTKMWHQEHGDPTRILIELGPRKTLATLAKQHATDRKNQIAIPSLSDNAENHAEWQALLSAVAQLWVAGVEIDWSLLSSNGQPRAKQQAVSLPTYAFQRKRYFIEPAQQNAQSEPTQPTITQPTAISQPVASSERVLSSQPEQSMSRLPTIVYSIHEVFENTSGFDLSEFEGDTTFFEMGLDSLVLTQTATALKKEFETEITFRQLLEDTSTVDSLAAWLDDQLPSDKFQSEPVADSQPSPTNETQPTPEIVENPAAPAAPLGSPANQTVVAQPLTTNLQTAQQQSLTGGNSVEHIVQTQLQLMQAQIALLSNQPLPADSQPIVAPATEPQATAPKPTCGDLPVAENKECGDFENSQSQEDESGSAKKAKRFATVKLNEGPLDLQQQAALQQIVKMNCAMMPNSKAYAQEHRRYMADPRTVSGFRPDMKEMTHPIVVERSQGVQLWDIDGNEYIDFTCGFGSNFLGHTH